MLCCLRHLTNLQFYLKNADPIRYWAVEGTFMSADNGHSKVEWKHNRIRRFNPGHWDELTFGSRFGLGQSIIGMLLSKHCWTLTPDAHVLTEERILVRNTELSSVQWPRACSSHKRAMMVCSLVTPLIKKKQTQPHLSCSIWGLA